MQDYLRDKLQSLVDANLTGKSKAEFVKDFPLIRCTLNPWDDLYLVFEYFKQKLSQEGTIKIGYGDMFTYLLNAYNLQFHVELFELRSGSYTPAFWTFLGARPSFIGLLSELVAFFKELKTYNDKFGINRPLELFEFRFYVQFIMFRERDYVELLKLDHKTREVASIHTRLNHLAAYRKQLADKLHFTYPTVKKYLDNLVVMGFRYFSRFQYEYIGLDNYLLVCTPPIIIDGTGFWGKNTIVRTSPLSLQSYSVFLAESSQALSIIKQKKAKLEGITSTLYKLTTLRHPESGNIFDSNLSQDHFSEDGEMVLNESFLKSSFEGIIEKYDRMAGSTEEYQTIPTTKLPPVPPSEINEDFLRIIWAQGLNAVFSIKHLRELTGLTKHKQKAFFDSYTPYFEYEPMFGSAGTIAGLHFYVTFEPPGNVMLDWHVNFFMDLFKTFPFKSFMLAMPINGTKPPFIHVHTLITREDVQTFYKYINHVETHFPMIFHLEIKPVILMELFIHDTPTAFFDPVTKTFSKIGKNLTISRLDKIWNY
ncbi:MAG: hypothetical protein EAX96_14895 [Candidatus Lokiarchaeota archaeon]|nr:hypothetical protein [Candidatus Lokiarchaeota archaeon]